ncbi:MAG: hypothetical protein AAFO79_12710, partial [Pseudomonadota bacterium]
MKLLWGYRLFLYAAIGLLIYVTTAKIIGVFLIAFELIFLVGRPIAREFMEWWQMRDAIIQRRRWLMSRGELLHLALRHAQTFTLAHAQLRIIDHAPRLIEFDRHGAQLSLEFIRAGNEQHRPALHPVANGHLELRDLRGHRHMERLLARAAKDRLSFDRSDPG